MTTKGRSRKKVVNKEYKQTVRLSSKEKKELLDIKKNHRLSTENAVFKMMIRDFQQLKKELQEVRDYAAQLEENNLDYENKIKAFVQALKGLGI